MTSGEDEFAVNRACWDELVPIHLASDYYDIPGFVAGRADGLHPFEVEVVGPVEGRDLVHLQCHFGMATLDWARRGARVTGLDFSEPAIAAARGLAQQMGLDARFVAANVYDATEALGADYDIVHTGLGALCWLPDLDRWAGVVATLLRPGGFLHLSEFHPVEQIMADDALTPTYPYFGGERLVFDDEGSYADPSATTVFNRTYEWIHGLDRVIGALLGRGFVIESFREHAHTVYRRFSFLEEAGPGDFRFPAGMPGVPMMYSLRARIP